MGAFGDFVSSAGSAVAGDVASSVIQGYYNRSSQKRQYKYEKWLRATQYQTAMEDMRKAGLNPILAYKQGGAGTPSISALAAGRPDIAGSLAKVSSSRKQAAETEKTMRLLDEQIRLAQNQADTEWQKSKYYSSLAAGQDVDNYHKKFSLYPTSESQLKIDKIKNDFLLDHPELIYGDMSLTGLGKLTGAIGNVLSIGKYTGGFKNVGRTLKLPSGGSYVPTSSSTTYFIRKYGNPNFKPTRRH